MYRTCVKIDAICANLILTLFVKICFLFTIHCLDFTVRLICVPGFFIFDLRVPQTSPCTMGSRLVAMDVLFSNACLLNMYMYIKYYALPNYLTNSFPNIINHKEVTCRSLQHIDKAMLITKSVLRPRAARGRRPGAGGWVGNHGEIRKKTTLKIKWIKNRSRCRFTFHKTHMLTEGDNDGYSEYKLSFIA